MSTSNALALPNEVPKYLAQYLGADGVKKLIAEAVGGISTGSIPTIVASTGSFTKKVSGEETVIVFPEMLKGEPHPAAGQTVSQLSVVVLRAKETLDKAWYAAAYSPGQEPQSPDCWSDDGARPDPSCTSPQNTACAGCPQNAFGSGTDAAGNPGKGKACSDRKRLAIFADNDVWKFTVPPASLQAWVAYCKQLGSYGLAPQFVITKIGFDPESKFKLTFTFGGVLGEAQIAKLLEIGKSQEVEDILAGNVAAAPASAPQGDDKKALEASKAAEAAAEAAKAEEKKKADAAKKEAAKAAKAKKDAEEAAAKAAAADDTGLDLGLDLGEGEASPALEPEVVANDEGPAIDDVIAELGL